MLPISEATSRVTAQNFSQKYIAMGRLLKQWNEIMGDEFAKKAQPLKLNYRKKGKNKKATASLDIATSAANATILNYQKGVILERINSLFGNEWIKDIRFIASELPEDNMIIKKKKIHQLTLNEEKYLSETLDQIEDSDIREKLEKLGKAIITDTKQ